MAKVSYVDLAAQNRAVEEELALALSRVLGHGQLILGPEVGELECKLAGRFGARDVVTCNSGTDALLLALATLELAPGDEVITTAHSFLATANAIRLAGATPVFADIDERTMVLDPVATERLIGPRTRAIIPVHLNGYPVELAPFKALCDRHGLTLIEDCAQSFGSSRDGRHTGADELGAFSFHPLKVFAACGDGGCLTVPDEPRSVRLRRLRNHGLVDRDHSDQVGYNSRLDTVQAAFLLVKLQRIDAALAARRARAQRYHTELEGAVRLPPLDPGVVENHSAFVVRHPDRDRVLGELARAGIDAKVHYPLGIHGQPPFTSARRDDLANTARVLSEIISLPVSAELSDADQDHIIATLGRVCRGRA